jgi:hypothetical protein
MHKYTDFIVTYVFGVIKTFRRYFYHTFLYFCNISDTKRKWVTGTCLMYNEIKRKGYKSDLRQGDLNYSQGTKKYHLWTQAKTIRKQLDKTE